MKALQPEGEAPLNLRARPWLTAVPKECLQADSRLPTVDLFTARQLHNMLLESCTILSHSKCIQPPCCFWNLAHKHMIAVYIHAHPK